MVNRRWKIYLEADGDDPNADTTSDNGGDTRQGVDPNADTDNGDHNNQEDDNSDEGTDPNNDENADETDEDDNTDEDTDDGDETTDEDLDIDTPDDTDDGDDNSDDSSDPNSDTSSDIDEEDPPSDSKKKDAVIYDSLDPAEQKLKVKTLKNAYVDLYSHIGSINDKLNMIIGEDEETTLQIKAVTSILFDLKRMVHDYLTNLFSTKSYIENDSMYNRYMLVLRSVEEFTKELKNMHKDEDEVG